MRFRQGLHVEQGPQREQCFESYLRPGRLSEGSTGHWVEHPARDGEPRPFAERYDELFVGLTSQAPDDINVLTEVGMVPVMDASGA